MVIDPDFFLYGDAFVTKKKLVFPGNFRKFDGVPAENKKRNRCWKFDPAQLEMYTRAKHYVMHRAGAVSPDPGPKRSQPRFP